MVERETWQAFRNSGLLWWVNRMLHLFGWAIVVELDDVGEVSACYPTRCSFRGFTSEYEARGFRRLTNHLGDNLKRMTADLDEDDDDETKG